jgi:FtsZ-binding cell division protein ZapB
MEVLEEFTRLDKRVRDAEKTLHSLQAERDSLLRREKEIYKKYGVSGYDELKKQLEKIKSEVEGDITAWRAKVGKVEEAVNSAEVRVGV